MATTLPPLTRVTVGKYRIEGLLGHGAMGTVALAYDPDIDRPVALKTIHAHLLDTDQREEYLRRFRQEARAAARASHPNIVTVYDAGIDAGTPYLAMEYVPGRSLKACLAERERFRPEDAGAILLQVLDALEHAHVRGVLHRDIKPANVLVLPDGRAKLTDFGVARLDTRQTTQLGALIGTPAYAAPEQLMGRSVTARSDLYSVGVLLAELVSGLRPDPVERGTILVRLRRGEPVDVPPGFLDVLERAMAEDPAARFASAAAMSEALRHSLDDRTIIELISGLTPCRTPPQSGPADSPPERWQAFASAAAPAKGDGLADSLLDRPALDTLEAQLTECIGPLARILVRRYAKEAHDKADLVRCLVAHIHDPDTRARFLADVKRGDRQTPDSPGTGAGAGILTGGDTALFGMSDTADRGGVARRPLDPARAAQLESTLTEHLGPLARMLMRRAIKTYPSEPELVSALARCIPDAGAREAFLAAARRS